MRRYSTHELKSMNSYIYIYTSTKNYIYSCKCVSRIKIEI